MIVTSKSIILNSRKYGDTSKIISVFSIDYGKISFIAKGARMPKNKFGSSLEPMSVTSATFYLKPNTDLYLLSKSELTQKNSKIFSGNEHLTCGFMIIESVSATQLTKNPNEELFVLLLDSITFLNRLEPNPQASVIWFFCRFAEIMGFAPNLDMSTIPLNGIVTILIESGSNAMLHQNFGSRIFKINSALAAKFNLILNSDLELTSKIELNRNEFSTLNNFFQTYFSYHLDMHFVLKSSNLV